MRKVKTKQGEKQRLWKDGNSLWISANVLELQYLNIEWGLL
jgi:hypothetical protein